MSGSFGKVKNNQGLFVKVSLSPNCLNNNKVKVSFVMFEDKVSLSPSCLSNKKDKVSLLRSESVILGQGQFVAFFVCTRSVCRLFCLN